jgi:ABC-type multidrug transport system ATPase subunit
VRRPASVPSFLEEIGPRIRELLERHDLKDAADKKPESLPLGVKQRLQPAVAVLHRPPILTLDEPPQASIRSHGPNSDAC